MVEKLNKVDEIVWKFLLFFFSSSSFFLSLNDSFFTAFKQPIGKTIFLVELVPSVQRNPPLRSIFYFLPLDLIKLLIFTTATIFPQMAAHDSNYWNH